jgi:two-component system chemotaxis sensor kinase CheA
MTIDMSQFYQVFYDECAEHLANMESLLLDLDLSDPDPEQLNAVFRAAHSIKGGAGTFGFTHIANTTHSLETLLDRLRKGELTLRAEMIDAFLRAKDVIAGQLAQLRGDGAVEADPQAAETVMKWLDVLAEDPPAQEPGGAPADSGHASRAASPAPVAAAHREAGLRHAACMRFDISMHAEGVEAAAMDRLFDELRAIGVLEILSEPAARKPRMSRSARMPWRLVLIAAVDEAALRDLFEFVVPAGDLEIASVAVDADAVSAFEPGRGLTADSGDATPGYGFFSDDTAALPYTPAAAAADPGYGLFDEAPRLPEAAAPSTAPAIDAGFGFFDDAPGAPVATQSASEGATVTAVPPPSVGRRKADQAGDGPVRAGRRATDKQVVPSGDSASIRVGVEKVDMLMNLVSELVITQSMLMQSTSKLDPAVHERLLSGVTLLERNTRDLQEAVMSIRMLPVAFVFSRFPRVVRDLAGKLGKQVELKTFGESAELDKGLIEKIADPLTHLVRNSLDHGIEAPEVRVAAGKPAAGTITLSAMHQGGNILIKVSDDGAGLDRDRILVKARERGLPVHDSMTDSEVWDLIFEAGFSTAAAITDISGRGVGMDVVRRNIAEMNGTVSIESTAGQGTRITIFLPLTMAILDGLSVRVGASTLIIPLNAIVESLRPSAQDVRTISGRARTVGVRGDYLNVIDLKNFFGDAGAVPNPAPVMVIVESSGHKAALCVDELLGQHQVVIKSLETNYRKVPGVSGATIMGDGQVALIVDVPGVVRGTANLQQAA